MNAIDNGALPDDSPEDSGPSPARAGPQRSEPFQPPPAPDEYAPTASRAAPPEAQPGSRSTDWIPETLRRRYLITDDGRYYFRDRGQALAFADLGQVLHTQHDDGEVAAAMVELAQAKGWTQVTLRGSVAFKREAWLAASERGLKVQGFRPQALDQARLEERLAARAQQASPPDAGNKVETRPPPAESPQAPAEAHPHHQLALEQLKRFLRQRGDSESAVAMTAQLAADQLARERTHFGKLLEHGPARYQFDPNNDPNYFATLETPGGRQTIWGVDLERALQDSGAAIGDGIVLSQRGSRQVAVTAPERDASGQPTGRREAISAQRHRWEVLSLDNARDFSAPAQQSRAGQAATDSSSPLPHHRGQSRAAVAPEHSSHHER